MARKLAFINYKGGVGKTSLVVNMAACLVQAGKRVLICDFDTQSNASIWLLRLDRWNQINASERGSIYSLFTESGVTLDDLIIPDVVHSKLGEAALPGLDLVPTTFNLVDLENEYTGDPACPPFQKFAEELRVVEGDYDYILFDCPPNILRASQCGVFAADEIYVPSNPDALSLIGFTLLVEKLERFQRAAAPFRLRTGGQQPQIQGIIFNAIKAGVDIEVPKMRMQLRLNQFRASRRVAPHARIFSAQVRDATIVRRAVTLGLPVPLLGLQDGVSNASTVVDDYRAITRELMNTNVMAVA